MALQVSCVVIRYLAHTRERARSILHNPRLTIDGFVGFRRQIIQHRFQLAALRVHLRGLGVTRYPDRIAPQKDTAPEGVGKQEAIPTFEEFFFEQLKVTGRIGRPVALAI